MPQYEMRLQVIKPRPWKKKVVPRCGYPVEGVELDFNIQGEGGPLSNQWRNRNARTTVITRRVQHQQRPGIPCAEGVAALTTSSSVFHRGAAGEDFLTARLPAVELSAPVVGHMLRGPRTGIDNLARVYTPTDRAFFSRPISPGSQKSLDRAQRFSKQRKVHHDDIVARADVNENQQLSPVGAALIKSNAVIDRRGFTRLQLAPLQFLGTGTGWLMIRIGPVSHAGFKSVSDQCPVGMSPMIQSCSSCHHVMSDAQKRPVGCTVPFATALTEIQDNNSEVFPPMFSSYQNNSVLDQRISSSGSSTSSGSILHNPRTARGRNTGWRGRGVRHFGTTE